MNEDQLKSLLCAQSAAAGASTFGGAAAPSGSSAETAQRADAATTTTSGASVEAAAPQQGGSDAPSVNGQQDEEAEVEHGAAESQPSAEADPIIHDTTAGVEPAPTIERNAFLVPAAVTDNEVSEAAVATE